MASIAVPRGANPMRGITVSQSGAVRQLVPPRTPSPGNVIHTGTSWPTLQVTGSTVKTVNQSPLIVTPPRGLPSNIPLIHGRANIQARTQQVTTRPVLHSAPGQIYKPVQSIGGTSLTVSQVGTKSGQTLVYTAVTTGQHLTGQTQRLNVTSPRQIQQNNQRTVSLSSANASRLGQGAVLAAAGGRLAVVVSNQTQPFNQQNTTATGTKMLTHPSSIQITQVQQQPQQQLQTAASKLTAQLQQQHQANVVAVSATPTVLPVTVTVTPSSRQGIPSKNLLTFLILLIFFFFSNNNSATVEIWSNLC